MCLLRTRESDSYAKRFIGEHFLRIDNIRLPFLELEVRGIRDVTSLIFPKSEVRQEIIVKAGNGLP
jgi:hypothetical protein